MRGVSVRFTSCKVVTTPTLHNRPECNASGRGTVRLATGLASRTMVEAGSSVDGPDAAENRGCTGAGVAALRSSTAVSYVFSRLDLYLDEVMALRRCHPAGGKYSGASSGAASAPQRISLGFPRVRSRARHRLRKIAQDFRFKYPGTTRTHTGSWHRPPIGCAKPGSRVAPAFRREGT
jgi:hypothetical protein